MALPQPSEDLVRLWTLEPFQNLYNAYAHMLARQNWRLAFAHRVWKVFFRGLNADEDQLSIVRCHLFWDKVFQVAA